MNQWQMNGRKIRNAITTALQYANWKGKIVGLSLMKDIIKTVERFDVYIEKLKRGSLSRSTRRT